MKKREKFLTFLIPVLLIFSGCSRIHTPDETAPDLRMVTRVDVACTRDGETIQRSYTAPEKLEAMLLYLRLLDPQGRADTNPEELVGTASEITLHFSNGQNRVYRQRGDRFLSKDAEPWQNIDQEHAEKLYPLLLLMDSDAV